MKQFILQKELAGIPAGAIFEYESIEGGSAPMLVGPSDVVCEFGTVVLSSAMVENRPEWFLEVADERSKL